MSQVEAQNMFMLENVLQAFLGRCVDDANNLKNTMPSGHDHVTKVVTLRSVYL